MTGVVVVVDDDLKERLAALEARAGAVDARITFRETVVGTEADVGDLDPGDTETEEWVVETR